MRKSFLQILLPILLLGVGSLKAPDLGANNAVEVLGGTSQAITTTTAGNSVLEFGHVNTDLVLGVNAIWDCLFPLAGDLALAGNTLTINTDRPLRMIGGSQFASLGGLTSSDASTKALLYLDPTVDKIVGNNSPTAGTERSASFSIGAPASNTDGHTTISWSQDGVLLAMAHDGDGSTDNDGKIQITEFVTGGFVTGTDWTNAGEATSANKFGDGAANQRFKVIRFRPIIPDPNSPVYVVAVGSVGASGVIVKRFSTSGSSGSLTVSHSANSTVASSTLEESDTIVGMEWNSFGDKLAVSYIDASDSNKYKVIVFSSDANGNLTSPTATPLDIDAWVSSATLSQHSFAWASDDQLVIAANHASNGEIRTYRVDRSSNALFRADLGSATALNRAEAVAYHPAQGVFAVGQNGNASDTNAKVVLYNYTNDQISSGNTLDLGSININFNDLKWHPGGKIISVATDDEGTKSYAYNQTAKTIDTTAILVAEGTADLKCIAWDPTKNFFARHDVAGTDVKAYSAAAPVATLTRIHMVLGTDIELDDDYTIADNCIIEGNGYKITMQPSAKITIAAGKTLTLRNCTLKGVRGNPGFFNNLENIVFASSSSTLRLENAIVMPTTHVRMTTGKIIPVGEGSYIDQRFAPFEFTNEGQAFARERESAGEHQSGDFEFNSESRYDPTTGQTIEIMSASTIPSGNIIDTGRITTPVSLPQATVSSSGVNFTQTINDASWSPDGRHIACIHTGDGDAGNADPGILRIDEFDPSGNSGAGSSTLKYDSRSDSADMVSTGVIDLTGTKGTVNLVEFRPSFAIGSTNNEFVFAISRNNPPSGTADIELFRYLPTATASEAARVLAVTPLTGSASGSKVTLGTGETVAGMRWSHDGRILAVIANHASAPKLRLYEYDEVGKTLSETSASTSGITCATPHHTNQLQWGRNNNKIFYIGKSGSDGVYQVFNVTSAGTSVTRAVNNTTTFAGKVAYRISVHPAEDTLAVSEDVSDASTVKLYTYDSATGSIVDAQGTARQKGTTQTLTNVDVVTDLKWHPSGQGLFVVSDDTASSPVINAFEYRSDDLGFNFGANANFGSVTTNQTNIAFGPGALFVGGEGSGSNNDRACIQVMAKKPAISKTGGTTSLTNPFTALVADFNIDSGTWTISGNDNDGVAPTRNLEIIPEVTVTVKSGATLHLKNLRLLGLHAAPPDPANGNLNICENLKIEGGGTLILENVVIEMFGEVRFDRSTGSGNATIEFTGSQPIEISSPGGPGAFAIGNSSVGNRVDSSSAGDGNMTVTFGSTETKIKSSILKAPTTLVPSDRITTPTVSGQRFSVGGVQAGSAHAQDMFRQMREQMTGASSIGMKMEFERQAGATGIPKQDMVGSDDEASPTAVIVGANKVLGADGEGDMNFTGHTQVILGGGDSSADKDLTRVEALNRSRLKVADNATVKFTGKGTVVLHDASLTLGVNAKMQFGTSDTDDIVVDLKGADITLDEIGSQIALGKGQTAFKMERSTLNAKKGTMLFNADSNGDAVLTGTVAEVKIIDSTITGRNDGPCLVAHPNKVTAGTEAKTTLTLESNKTSAMELQYKTEKAVITPPVSQDVIAEARPMCCVIADMATPANSANSVAGDPIKTKQGGAVAFDKTTGKFLEQPKKYIGTNPTVVPGSTTKIDTIDDKGIPIHYDTVTGTTTPAV